MLRKHAVALLMVAGLTVTCTKAQLEFLPEPPPPAFDNKLVVTGDFCTQSSEDLEFPLRVLFLVDASESMEITDPPDPVTGITNRERAVLETSQELLSSGGDVKISIVRFSSQAQPLTEVLDENGELESYFTDDIAQIEARLPTLGETDRTTNYINALSEAYAEVRFELQNAEQESLSLSNYQVIMLTDGLPDAEGAQTVQDANENILDAVNNIAELASLFHVDEFGVSTALIASGNAQVDTAAEDLLKQMAETGGGTYRAFLSGGDLNFLFVDVSSLRRVFTLGTLVAQNVHAWVGRDEVLPDSDGDGLSDEQEARARTDPFLPDTDGDGCRDSLEVEFVQSGLDPLNPDDCDCLTADYCFDLDGDGLCDSGCADRDGDQLCDCNDEDFDGVCDPDNYPDGDGDGLVDCEERWAGTNKRGSDTDGDGLVDFHEMRFGTAPDIDDATDDFDWDAVDNGEEVRAATDPRFVSEVGRHELAYRYNVVEFPSFADGTTCYEFEIGNVTLTELGIHERPTFAVDANTVGPGGQGWYEGHNRVLVYVGEVPFDDQEAYSRFRVGCVEAEVRREGNYRNPPSGRMHLTEDDFVLLSEFDAMVHCVRPEGEVEVEE